MGLFKNKEREYAEIHIEYDSESDSQQQAVVKGDETTISAIIGALIHNLLIGGFDRELLEFAILKALKDSKKTRRNKKIQVKEIHINEENEKELKDLLDKILKED